MSHSWTTTGPHDPTPVTFPHGCAYCGGIHEASAGPGLEERLLVAALVEVEEQKISAHPECLTDTCDHEKCPDWGSLGCGDAQAIAAAYNRLAAARLPVTEEHGGFDEDQGWQERGSDE